MKKRKILFGIIAAILVFGTYAVNAQGTEQKLSFLGPDNLAGRSRTVIVDKLAEGEEAVLYTAGVAGGLYKSENGGKTWTNIPYVVEGKEVSLPISCMVQLANGDLVIGTGEGLSVSALDGMGLIVPEGSGIYVYSRATNTIVKKSQNELLNSGEGWKYMNKLVADGATVYIASNGGLAKVELTNDSYSIENIFSEGKVEDVEIAGNVLYFTSGSKVFVVKDRTASLAYTELVPAYANNASRIELAVAPSDSSHVYMTVADANGLLDGVYFSNASLADTTLQVISKIDTDSSIANIESFVSDVFVSDSTIVIDTNVTINHDTINLTYDTVYAYDTTLVYSYDTIYGFDTTYAYTYDTTWVNKSFVACPWVKISTSSVVLFQSYNGWYSNTLAVDATNPKKIYLGGSNFWVAEGLEGTDIYTWTQMSMSAIGRPSSYYVHENIHDIAFLNDSVYYLATDGGIFKYGEIYDGLSISGNSKIGFSELNKGLTTTQFTTVEVANDGSVFGGAIGHAIPYIKSREDSDITIPTNDTVNHSAESMWVGNGGWVAASRFHQTAPTEKEVLFVSAEGGNFGRATSDYFNYTNTQTWTIGSNFNGRDANWYSGYNPAMVLWEKTDDTMIKDSITFKVSVPCVIIREDSAIVVTGDFTVQPGDKYMVRNQAANDYPIEYTFTQTLELKAGISESFTIKNPFQSRLFVGAGLSSARNHVFMNTTPSDFRKIGTDMKWYTLINMGGSVAKALAVTEDGDCLFIAAEKPQGGSDFIRIRNLNAVDPAYQNGAGFQPGSIYQETIIDTIKTTNSVITSISVDPISNSVVITCDGSADEANVYLITNATSDNPVIVGKTIENNVAIYSSLIEKKDGALFLGTENGVYKMANATASTAEFYALAGVPVTFIKQQTNELEFKRVTYYTGTNSEEYRFGRTKYPYAIYFATYGKGIYVDKSFVTDNSNEVGIAEVEENISGLNIYPNPAASFTTVELEIAKTTNASIRVFDMSGKVVYTKSLNNLTEGVHTEKINCQRLQKGVYLINVVTDSQMMTSKLVVK